MIILQLDTKKCMSSLLLNESFDHFSFIEGEITTFSKFTMEGYLQKDFFEEPPGDTYALWKDMRMYCFSIIKGKRTPLRFHLILSLSGKDTASFLLEQKLDFSREEIGGLFLNFRFDGAHLSCTTGVSTSKFTLDKSLEHAWDKWVQSFFASLGIPFECA